MAFPADAPQPGVPQAASLHERLAGFGSWRLDLASGHLACSQRMLEMLDASGPIDSVEALVSHVTEGDRGGLAAALATSSGPLEAVCHVRHESAQVESQPRRFLLRGEISQAEDGTPAYAEGILIDCPSADSVAKSFADEAAGRQRLDRLLRRLVEATIEADGIDDLVRELTMLGISDPTRWTYSATFLVEADLSLTMHTECGAAPSADRASSLATAADVVREDTTLWCYDDGRYAFPVHAEGEVALVFVLDRADGPVSRPQADLMAERVDELIGWALERHRTQEALREARDEATRASAAKSRFLASVSHEVRTPLHAILESTDRALGTDLSPVQRELCQATLDSGRHLLSMIDDVLDLSAVEAGNLRLHPRDLDIRQLGDNLAVRFAGSQLRRRPS